MKKFLVLMLLFASSAFALDGKITKAHDGDSFYVTGVTQEIRVRYADTPEFKAFTWGNQPFAAKAREDMLKLCGGQVVTLTKMTLDKRTNRYMANVSCQGQDLATYLIKNGDAWAYRFTSTKATRALQASAKAKGIGLWALPNPIEPYLWRKNGMH